MSIASIRSPDGTCPQEVLKFMMDLFKYNSNHLNKVILLVSSYLPPYLPPYLGMLRSYL